jgi:hypothetical protein
MVADLVRKDCRETISTLKDSLEPAVSGVMRKSRLRQPTWKTRPNP